MHIQSPTTTSPPSLMGVFGHAVGFSAASLLMVAVAISTGRMLCGAENAGEILAGALACTLVGVAALMVVLVAIKKWRLFGLIKKHLAARAELLTARSRLSEIAPHSLNNTSGLNREVPRLELPPWVSSGIDLSRATVPPPALPRLTAPPRPPIVLPQITVAPLPPLALQNMVANTMEALARRQPARELTVTGSLSTNGQSRAMLNVNGHTFEVLYGDLSSMTSIEVETSHDLLVFGTLASSSPIRISSAKHVFLLNAPQTPALTVESELGGMVNLCGLQADCVVNMTNVRGLSATNSHDISVAQDCVARSSEVLEALRQSDGSTVDAMLRALLLPVSRLTRSESICTADVFQYFGIPPQSSTVPATFG